MTADLPDACPRCRSTTVEVQSTSPVSGAWTVFSCTSCLYSWRSTEPAENTDPDRYPAAFRLVAEQLAGLPVEPAVPPVRTPALDVEEKPNGRCGAGS